MCDVGVLHWERSGNKEFLSTMTRSCPNISTLEFKPLKRNGRIYERPCYCNLRIGPQDILLELTVFTFPPFSHHALKEWKDHCGWSGLRSLTLNKAPLLVAFQDCALSYFARNKIRART